MSAASTSLTSTLSAATLAVLPEGTSSEVINAVQAMLEETTTRTASTSSIGCTADEQNVHTECLVIRDSILTLLLKLHSKLSGGKLNSYVPEALRSSAALGGQRTEESRIGDGAFFVGNVLDKIGRSCDHSRCKMEAVYQNNTAPTEKAASGKKKPDLEER